MGLASAAPQQDGKEEGSWTDHGHGAPAVVGVDPGRLALSVLLTSIIMHEPIRD